MPSLPELPALEALPGLRAALSIPGAAVFTAPPGSGKTTLVPLALLDEPWLAGQRILMLGPRRVAARAAARRMASLLGEEVGRGVGYQVRFERRISAATRIEVITEGLLARRLQADPELPGVGLVIFDEFHERSLDADLGLALTLDARDNLRPALKVLVMSATIDAARVAALLGGAPVVSATGRLFPVTIRQRPVRADEDLAGAVAATVRAALAEHEGDVLSFLPGAREIRAVERRLADALPVTIDIRPLSGELSGEVQDLALTPAAPGRRKVILATNIAQTSLTVEGVTVVVDSGYARVARHDLGAGANRLDTERISRAAAEQRAGRAGRLAPGVCYRLWSAEQQGRLAADDTPEILLADLSRFALDLAGWGVRDPADLRLLDAPPAAAWSAATGLLAALGAVDAHGRITEHGRALLRLPLDPRRGHLLVRAGALGLTVTAAWVAAVLDERGATPLDLSDRVAAAFAGRGPDPAAARRTRDTVGQLLRQAGDTGSASTGFDAGAIGRLVALAFPERIARRRAEGRGLFLCADGAAAQVPEHDPLAQREWLAIAHWQPGPPRRVLAAAVLDEATVRADQAEQRAWRSEVRWDPAAEGVIAEERRSLGAIVLDRRPLRDAPERVRGAMLEGIRMLGIDALPWTLAARQWRARMESLRRWHPEHGGPALDDASLAQTLEDWLGPHLDGLSRREHLGRLDLAEILSGRLDFAARQRLARLVPTHLQVPSGSRIELEYASDGRPPVLAVKLQELFGLTRTPAVDEGRMPVMLHLLSPARRPIQVTRDLAGFWERTYAGVRKELKGRYPKHPWPEDPLAAPPTARAKPREG